MVRLTSPENYKLLRYEVHPGNKKYNAILENKKTGSIVKVGFGQKGAAQYKDKIGHYKHLDHLDKKRRMLYRTRHFGEDDHKYSSGYFAIRLLW